MQTLFRISETDSSTRWCINISRKTYLHCEEYSRKNVWILMNVILKQTIFLYDDVIDSCRFLFYNAVGKLFFNILRFGHVINLGQSFVLAAFVHVYRTAHNQIDVISGYVAVTFRFHSIEFVSLVHNVLRYLRTLYIVWSLRLTRLQTMRNVLKYRTTF